MAVGPRRPSASVVICTHGKKVGVIEAVEVGVAVASGVRVGVALLAPVTRTTRSAQQQLASSARGAMCLWAWCIAQVLSDEVG